MTTSQTRTAPRVGAHEARREHAVQHEHSWVTASRHPTSAGFVLYVRCTACGIHRVDLERHRDLPPAPLSRLVSGHVPDAVTVGG
jgi:hypothetical protein